MKQRSRKHDADRFRQAYIDSINKVAAENFNNPEVPRPTISIKLSALHPRYEVANHDRVMTELAATLTELITLAKNADVGVTIDAEEMDRLELSLELFEKVYRSGVCKGWPRFGLVVQAYSKRALPVLCWINALAKEMWRRDTCAVSERCVLGYRDKACTAARPHWLSSIHTQSKHRCFLHGLFSLLTK